MNTKYYCKNENKDCYICMEPVEYYFKFECGCHIYSHTECINNYNNKNKNNTCTKCILCKKSMYIPNKQQNNIFLNIKWLMLFMTITKIDEYIKNLLELVIVKKNFTSILLFVIISFGCMFGIVMPVYIINVMINIIVVIYEKIFCL